MKAHNDLVRGWRHYYGGNSPEMDRELEALDAWRHDRCRDYLESRGIEPALADAWFERLMTAGSGRFPGAYGDWHAVDGEMSAAEDVDRPDSWHYHEQTDESSRRTASRSNELRAAEIGRRQTPILFDDRWLRIPTYGAFVTRSKDILIVRRKKQTIFECAFDEVSAITLEGRGVVMSTTVLERCIERGIALTLARASGKAVGRFASVRAALRAPDVRRQLAVAANRAGTTIASAILSAKLANQRALLLYHAKYRRRPESARRRLLTEAQAIQSERVQLTCSAGAPMRRARRDLFLLEARAAAHYWAAFGALLPEPLRFRGRQHQRALDPVNKALNYGYGILGSRVWTAILRAGLEPSLGILHTGRRRSNALVFDLIEPYRQPVVDRSILSLIGRGWRPVTSDTGELTLRTRAALHRALSKRLQSGTPPIGTHVNRCATTLRLALTRNQPYCPYHMSW